MHVVLVKSNYPENWYTIERAEHENRYSLTRLNRNDLMCHYSGRLSDADIEGTADEMLSLAKAIESRGHVSFRRCAVRVVGDKVFLCSPRNSIMGGEISLVDADALAKQIRTELGAQGAT